MSTTSTSLPATIVVADAAPVFRRGLLQLLSQALPAYAFHEAGTYAELLAHTAVLAPALVITAADLPGGPAAPDQLLAELRGAQAQAKVVVLTHPATVSEPAMLRLLRHNVNGLLNRLAPLEEVCDTVHQVLQRGRCYSDGVLTLLQRQLQRPQAGRAAAAFTPRQLEVLRLMAQDLCNEEIADCLCTSVRTVEYHRSQMLHKAGTRTTLGLVLYALRQGLLTDVVPAYAQPALASG